MAIFKCKMCGGDLEINEGVTIAECEYCGTKQTVPKAKDENLQNLFNRANTLRIKSEFDKAEKLYEKIIQADTTQSEAYWGLILCKYGIEYVDDPATYKKVPTCHRASYDSIIADDDYKAAIANADAGQRALYEEQAKEIDRIQKEILALAQNEEKYDVFICYKETDADGRRTQDSAIANDIYYQLTQEGFKVFYAAITLEGKLGSAYEPIIFAALNSAKVMLVIGTKPEYFNAVWVKNEWSRFLKIIKKDRSKLLIPCYRDMDAYELPEEFAHLQAQDMSKIGFINDIVRGIQKVIKKDEPKTTVVKETVVTNTATNVEPLLKRAFMFLEDGEWNSANEYAEKVLDINPENAKAYLVKLMAELRIRKMKDLGDGDEPYNHNPLYEKAFRFGDEELKKKLEDYSLSTYYNQAIKTLRSAETEKDYSSAAEKFKGISGYRDADEKVKECLKSIDNIRERAEAARKDEILKRAKNQMEHDTAFMYGEAIKDLESIRGWKDADEQLLACRRRIEQLNAKEEATQKKIKKAFAIATPIVCVIILFVILLNNVFIPNSKYKKAIALKEAGQIVEAYEALLALDGYKDSTEIASSIHCEYEIEKIKEAKVGDYIKFGTYEQDNNTANGAEEIEWLVLEKRDGKALVISRYLLDCKAYGNSSNVIAWNSCSLRKWLNNSFLNSAFSEKEKASIPTVTISDEKSIYGIHPGAPTEDKVFLLSVSEAKKYFSDDGERICAPTDYLLTKIDKEDWYVGYNWWLRSPGHTAADVAFVYPSGNIGEWGESPDIEYYAIRPAMWIDLDSAD